MRSPHSSDRPRGRPFLRLVKSDVAIGDSELSERISDSLARAQAIQSNQRAASSHPDEVAAAEELAILVRAQQLLAKALKMMPS